MTQVPNQYRALLLNGAKDVSVVKFETAPLSAGEVRIKLGAAGICGTDLHYFADYANAGFGVQTPLTLGHEASGTVVEVGAGVIGIELGDKVAVNPVVACGHCRPCVDGKRNLCERKRFPGSATTVPHIHGFFREYFEFPAAACTVVSPDTNLSKLAFVEPLACSLHAIERAGPMLARRVLVSGAGPIGIFAAAAAKIAGASRVTMTDLCDNTLAIAKKMGIDEVINVASDPQGLSDSIEMSGLFDVVIEASGAVAAVNTGIDSVRRGGTLVLLSNLPAGGVNINANLIMLKEINFLGTMQFGGEFEKALRLIVSGQIDVSPMLTAQYDLSQAEQAFAEAKDRTKSMKIQLISEGV
ncbi:alcohol dehydrogenase catalytic domain-containing protein [Thaumasiovibrio sp. DFM-14]|uniref:alcohol dehydrogenase catalytic domain-containing protein n=1 Tax=Thaumasiovibrio sp. DFM-14 TaxID=3384792 RepID=UPI0039A36BC5